MVEVPPNSDVKTVGLLESLGPILGYRASDLSKHEQARAIEELVKDIATTRLKDEQTLKRLLRCFRDDPWELDIGLKRMFAVLASQDPCRDQPGHDTREIITDTENPSRRSPIRRQSIYVGRQIVGWLFQIIINRPEWGYDPRFDVIGEAKRRLNLSPEDPIVITDNKVKEVIDDIRRERRTRLISGCHENATKFIETIVDVSRERNAPFITPSILIEHYSDGRFGQKTIGPGFISDNPEFFVEMNESFLECMDLKYWPLPLLKRYPDRKAGGRPRKGMHRIHLFDFLGAALTSYFRRGKRGPWWPLYDWLDHCFIALRREGDSILVLGGPSKVDSVHGHNFLATFEEIQAVAREHNSNAIVRPWYWKNPPRWWDKRWLGKLHERQCIQSNREI